jgi:hypothetical protein
LGLLRAALGEDKSGEKECQYEGLHTGNR